MAGARLLTLLDDIATMLDDVAMMTVGVYGLVAAIVKLDDLRLWLARQPRSGPLGLNGGRPQR